MIRKVFLFLLFFMFFAVSCFARDFYVRPSGGNYGNEDGSSYADAWDGFSNINWSTVDSGNGKLFVAGTHYETLQVSADGEDGTPIKLVSCTVANGASTNDAGTIDGRYTRDIAVLISRQSYVRIEGLKIQNTVNDTQAAVTAWGGLYLEIANLTIENDTDRGIKFDGSTNSIIENCTIESTGTSNAQTDAIFVQNGSDNIIKKNSVTLGADPSSSHVDAIQVLNEENLTISGNYLAWASGKGNGDCQTIIMEEGNGWYKIYNNIIIGCEYQPYQALLIKSNDYAKTYIWNNYIESTNKDEGWGIRLANNSANIEAVKNNIVISPNGQCIVIDNGASTPSNVDYNLVHTSSNTVCINNNGYRTWEQWKSDGYDIHGKNNDPSLDNFKPDSESDPVVDTGTAVSSFRTDMDGNNRPQGSKWDIGAFEYKSMLLEPPSDLRINISFY